MVLLQRAGWVCGSQLTANNKKVGRQAGRRTSAYLSAAVRLKAGFASRRCRRHTSPSLHQQGDRGTGEFVQWSISSGRHNLAARCRARQTSQGHGTARNRCRRMPHHAAAAAGGRNLT